MPNQLKTMTSPRAIIKGKDGKAIGLIRNIRISETISRGSVRGLGTLYESERPALSFSGTWNCDQMMIDLKQSGITGLDNRNIPDDKIWEQTKILLEDPIDIYIYKKEAQTVDENGNVTESRNEGFAVIRDVYLDSMSFDIAEGSVSSYNQSGVYTKPVIIPA